MRTNEAERAAWREQAKQLPTQDLVMVDETGSRINMTRSTPLRREESVRSARSLATTRRI